jgi:sugar phosphate isomerase/epimerase
MPSRRNFLRSLPLVSGTLAFGMASACSTAAKKQENQIGIQLWTLRDDVNKNLNGTLESLAQMGYNSIEAFGFDGMFYGQKPRDFSNYCAGLGLKLHSTHTGITAENADDYAEKAAEAGLSYLILPSMMGRPESSLDDFRRVADEMNVIGESCKKNGIQFGYHNHDFEFRPMEDELPYDILLRETDPELVSFQLDIYWMVKAGKDPLKYFEAHSGRFKTWHIKDKANDGQSCIIGNGIIDFKELLKLRKTAGLEYIFVEQEQYSEGTPIYCAEQSLNYIRNHFF